MYDKITYSTCAICGIKLKWKYCRVCKLHQKEYRKKQQKERYDALKEKGLCVRCGKPAEENNIRCTECIDKNKKRSAEYYQLNPEAAKNRVKASKERRKGQSLE